MNAREASLVLLFCLIGLLSIPLAIDPAQAWHEFSDTFIRCIVIFVVMVNVVRTEKRLNGLVLLALVTGIWLSLGAINDYRLGLMTVEGYRAGGRGSGIFGNSNDMALFLVTIVPIAIALLLGSRSQPLKSWERRSAVQASEEETMGRVYDALKRAESAQRHNHKPSSFSVPATATRITCRSSLRRADRNIRGKLRLSRR